MFAQVLQEAEAGNAKSISTLLLELFSLGEDAARLVGVPRATDGRTGTLVITHIVCANLSASISTSCRGLERVRERPTRTARLSGI
jgi:hypothetical protein